MGKRHKEILTERKKYIQNRVKSRNCPLQSEVKRIARDLFISERTVYRDLYKVDD